MLNTAVGLCSNMSTHRTNLLRPVAKFVKRVLAFFVRTIVSLFYEETNSVYAERWHPHHLLRQKALEDTVSYIQNSMSNAMIMKDEYQVLSYALSVANLSDGLYLEFGVRSGATINHIARQIPDKTVYGFDSFEGLPENWAGWMQVKGTFGGEGIPKVESNVELVKGWFDQSLPDFLQNNTKDVAFIHIDSDLYSSAKTILSELSPHIKHGTIVVFNEYFNYPNWREHEFRALQKFNQSSELDYEYLCWGKFEVAIRFMTATADAPTNQTSHG